MPNKKTIFTIGFTKKTLEQFCNLLTGAGVKTVIDIRRRPGSQLAGFAKKVHLKYILEHFLKITYIHEPLFAPSEELLRYRKSKNWNDFQAEFTRNLNPEKIARFKDLALNQEPLCFLCSEHKPAHCHRRVLVDFMISHLAGSFEIKHLE